MPFSIPHNSAEASDTLATLTAWAASLAALVYSVNIAEVFVTEAVAAYLGYGQILFGLVILLGYLPALIFLKSRGGRPTGASSPEGFLNASFRQAAFSAFSLTIAFLIALSLFDRLILANVTAKTAIDLVVVFALAAFAASFLVIKNFSSFGEAPGDGA